MPFLIDLEQLYFRGGELLKRLGQELVGYHRSGHTTTKLTVSDLHTITVRLQGLKHVNDLDTVLGIVLADCLHQPDASQSLKEYYETHRHLMDGNRLKVRPDNAVTRNELVRFVSIFAPQRIPDLIVQANIPESLPLIDFLVEKLPPLNQNVCAVHAVQHLFGSSRPLFLAIGKTLSNQGMFLLGKPYSTNHATYWALRAVDGYNVHEGSFDYDGSVEYHVEAERNIRSQLDRALRWLDNNAEPDSRLLILDDGGLAIRIIHEMDYRSVLDRVCAVEQTRRGITELSSTKLEIPVVNVAESRAKLEFESPMIARSVLKELRNTLSCLEHAGVPISQEALIVGYGAIGKAIAIELRKDSWRVGVYDNDPKKLANAVADGFVQETVLRDALARYSEIIGCSGTASLTYDDYEHLADHALLVSASSSDLEFSAWQTRSLAHALSADFRYVDNYNLVYERFGDRLLYLGDLDHPCHFLYLLRINGRTIFLVNGGFPVNMNGEVDPIAPEEIQLTRALLYAGAVQASHSEECGLIDLSETYQSLVLSYF